jgi:hypothetical protein
MIRPSIKPGSMGKGSACGGLNPKPRSGRCRYLVIPEDRDLPFEGLTIQDRQPGETFIADGSHETLGDGMNLWARSGLHDLDHFCSRHLSTLPVNF